MTVWDSVKTCTLTSAWKRLITFTAATGRVVTDTAATTSVSPDHNDKIDFVGFDIDNMHHLFFNSGEDAVTIKDITDWLKVDTHDPGHGFRTKLMKKSWLMSRQQKESPLHQKEHLRRKCRKGP